MGTNVTTQSVVNYAVVVKGKQGSTPILHSQFSILNSERLQYYNLRGESFGTTKPTKAGIYLIKQGSTVQKIVVR